jgi:YVTN family beta-propeller protein
LKTSPTSDRGVAELAAGIARSRAVRVFLAFLLVVIIVTPAAVVGAVVWTVPPPKVATPLDIPTDGRALAPADIQPTSLPKAALNVYANTMSGVVPCPLCQIPQRVYVPNSVANTVDVIDPTTYTVIRQFPVAQIPHHITPAWDMSALYVDNEGSSELTVLDPHTGKVTGVVHVPYPYNLYFTPDGTKAIDVVEREMRVEFYDWRHGWKPLKSVAIPWPGADHMDFSADGSYFMISTEYSGIVAKVDVNKMALVGYVRVGGLPIDVKLSPDGRYFYVTNQGTMGVTVIDPVAMKVVKFIPTGRGAHGLQISRDTTKVYVSNRLEGSISVIDFATMKVVAKWWIPGGGSPDMLQLNPQGTRLWASGRYNATVYVFDTTSGKVVARIRVGAEDHGLTYFPNVGLHSLGHNGVYR